MDDQIEENVKCIYERRSEHVPLPARNDIALLADFYKVLLIAYF